MNVLFVSSECSPFIKTGGLADVLGSLPKTLSSSINCNVVIPYYKKIKDENIGQYLTHIYFDFNNDRVYAGVYFIKRDNVIYYFIDNNDFFYVDNIYGTDDFIRFTFFNFAVIELLNVLGKYDLLHLNDWHTGLIPFLIKYKYNLSIKTLFTIHNLQYQGIFDKNLSSYIGIYNETLEFNNTINFLKCAIVNSDIVTTVSSTYKTETLSYEYSYSLENVLLNKKEYYGIVNGIDTSFYNPKTDKYIYRQYENIYGKVINKKLFCKEHSLNTNMLCSIVTRLCDQKGIELITQSIDDIMLNTNVNLFLMGCGDKHYEEMLLQYSLLYPQRIKIYIGYNEELALKVYAASDLLLVPSKFEPCGLSQLIAMRYATLPLVRETGGLKDTVEPYNQYTNTGCGFTFKDFDTSSFKDVFYLAYNTYQNEDVFNMLKNNALQKDFSFEKSAKEYKELYRRLIQ